MRTREETARHIDELSGKIEELFKQYDCAGICCIYSLGPTGMLSPEQASAVGSDFQSEGHGRVVTMLKPSFSVMRPLSEMDPGNPMLEMEKEHGGEILVFAIKQEEARGDKDVLRSRIGPTINMARTLAILMNGAAGAAIDTAHNAVKMAEELGIGTTVSGFTPTGTGMDDSVLPPEVRKTRLQ